MGKSQDLEKLQITIFTRWCYQKLASRHIKIKDCTKELDGVTLVALLEVLSEQTYPKKMKKGKMKMQKIDNLNQALNWSFKSLGVVMKLKPSAENFLAGRVEQILGYLWTLFLKYTVIGDEDEDEKDRLSAEDSLLMWIQNQVKTYANVKITNLTKSFHNGLALCALIHKFRPKLIDYDSLGPNNSKKNLQTAFDAAEKFFGLEQYLKPDDIQILSKKEMMIYISEYYYGIAEQRKHDLAARRIGKLITYTETNDRLKSEYLVNGKKLSETLKKIVEFLSDYTIDNTYSGAKKRVVDFDKYKATEKGEIGGTFLSLETQFNHIAMRLADHNRPVFEPKENSIQQFQELLKTIDKLEKEQNIRLHKELNRQEKLVQWNDLHKVNFEKLLEWTTKQQTYLKEKEEITTSGQAQYHINKLEGYRVECANIKNESGGQLKDLAKQLADEKYEFIKTVDDRISQMEKSFATLDELANAKEPILLDHLERCKYRESVLLEVEQHVDKFNKLNKWIKEKEAFLQKKEDINSISDAQLHLSLIGAYAKEKQGYTDVNIVSLTDLGQKILASEYKSDISQWVYEKPDEVKGRESNIDELWKNLDVLYAAKLAILEDALELEKYKAKVRLMNSRHITNYDTLDRWIKEKNAYLRVKEVVESSSKANKELDTIGAYAKEKQGLTDVNVVSLKQLGEEIRSALYKSEFNEWKFETPEEVTGREQAVDDAWVVLDGLYDTKLAILKDDLARNTFIEALRLSNKQHIARYGRLDKWANEKKAYLLVREDIDSIKDAETQLGLLEVYNNEMKDVTQSNYSSLLDLGKYILEAEYKSELSQWAWETPDEIKEREAAIVAFWKELDGEYAKKLAVAKDNLAREEFRAHLNQLNDIHIAKDKELNAWAKKKDDYLSERVFNDSVAKAQTAIGIFEEYEREKKSTEESTLVNFCALGKKIIDAEYKSDLSSFKFKTPEEINKREDDMHTYFALLDRLAVGTVDEIKTIVGESDRKLTACKKEKLADDLAREKYRAATLLMNQQHIAQHTILTQWIKEKNAYLKVKEDINSIADAQQALDDLASYSSEKGQLTKTNIVSFTTLGKKILDRLYETFISSWKFKTPEEINEREENIASEWNTLDELYAKKLAVGEDDLAREIFKENLRLRNAQHITQFGSLKEWYAKKKEYLLFKDPVDSVPEAQKNLANLDIYSNEKKDITSSNVAQFKSIGKHILEAEYKTDLSQWVWPTRDEVTGREDTLDDDWKELDGLHAKKLAVLEDDLAREEFREALRLQNEQHKVSSAELKEWYKTKDEYLKQREEIDSISDAQGQIGILKGYEAEKKDLAVSNVNSWKGLGKEIIDAEYKTDLSSFKFKTPEEIVKREGDLDADWKNLDELSATKKEWLDEQLRLEILKEKLRLQYANLAGSFERYVVSNNEKIRNWNFGFSLEDVQNYEKVLNSEKTSYGEKLEAKEKAFQEPYKTLQEMKDTHLNNYTELTLDDLEKCKESLKTALVDRKSAWDVELKRQLDNDALCEKFAKKALAFVGLIDQNKDKITHSEEKLDVQLEFIVGKQESKDGEELPDLKSIQADMDERKIGTNRHTVLNYNDVDTQYAQYVDFLGVKAKMLKEEIQNSMMRGITPEQYAEIEGQFKEFDKDNTQNLDKNEFKACLYSLNDERGKKEIAAIMNEYGSVEEGINYDGFKEFMIKELGDAGTKEEVLEGFLLLAHGNKHVTKVDLEQLLEDHFLTYLHKNAPPLDNGYDYAAWSDDVYAR